MLDAVQIQRQKKSFLIAYSPAEGKTQQWRQQSVGSKRTSSVNPHETSTAVCVVGQPMLLVFD